MSHFLPLQTADRPTSSKQHVCMELTGDAVMSPSACWLEASGRGKNPNGYVKYPRIEMIMCQFELTYRTEIIAIVQCMYADYVV